MKQCQECGLNPANVHITQIVDTESRSFHLCEECAQKQGIHIVIAEHTMEAPPDDPPSVAETERVCGTCRKKLSEFRSKGWLGCPSCYSVFGHEVDELLLQMHGSTEHQGKRYRNAAVPVALTGLHRELECAIKTENFERAAIIRDTIGHLKGAPGA